MVGGRVIVSKTFGMFFILNFHLPPDSLPLCFLHAKGLSVLHLELICLTKKSGQISSRLHTTSPEEVAEKGKSPYFREIQVGEIS